MQPLPPPLPPPPPLAPTISGFSPSPAGTFVAFGPRTYERSTATPVTVTDNFSVLNPSTQFFIRVRNANVASALIMINGVTVVGPQEFNPNVEVIEKPVKLLASNEIDVQVRSEPGTSITVEIIGIDNDPPTIKATASPPPNASGWNNTNVTVTFSCSDATSGIASCTSPVTVISEGANEVVTGTAVDRAGNTATASVTLNIDKTPPTLTIASPANGATVATPNLPVSGTVADSLSGISTVTCNGSPASVQAGTFNCSVSLVAGPNTVSVQGTDIAGNSTAQSIMVSLFTGPAITDFSPKSGPVGTLVTVTGNNFVSPSGTGPQVSLSKQGGGTISAPVSGFTATTISFVIATGAATGPFTVTVGAQSATSPSPLTITASSNFSLAVAPGAGTLIRGQSTAFAVTLSSVNGFAQLAALSVSGLPAGVTGTFTQTQITAGQTALLTLTAPAGQATGSATITVSASATVQGIAETQSATATLNVQAVSTTFLGRTVVQDPTETPLAGVTITMLGVDGNGNPTGCSGQTVSDLAGNFAIAKLPSACVGDQLIRYDGTTATSPPGKYAGVDLLYTFVAGQVTTPPVLIHLPRIDNAETKMVQQNASVDQTFTFSTIPGLSVTVYAGTIFTLSNGTQPNPFPLVGIQVPVDRLPDVMPQMSSGVAAFIVAFQPANSVASQPVAVTFPNTLSTLPGTNMPLMTLDPTKGVMVQYGTGTVSADAAQIVPDADPAHPGHNFGLVHFDWHGPVPPSPPGGPPAPPPAPGDCPNPGAGEPIDLASGLEVIRQVDVLLQGQRRSVSIVRTYRTPANPNLLVPGSGPFGVGGNHNYSYQLSVAGVGAPAALPPVALLGFPDGNAFFLILQPNGTYTNSTIPALRGAVLTQGANGSFTLRWKNGTTFRFQTTTVGPAGVTAVNVLLDSITDPNGNVITLVRNPSRPRDITQIVDPVGRQLNLTYDSSGSPTAGVSDRITSITDPLGRTVQYTYNSQGTLAAVTDANGGVTAYEYDSQNQVTKVTDPRGVVVAQNTYDANGRVAQQVQADGGVIKLSYTLANPFVPAGPVLLTVMTDPLGNTTTYHFNPQGFLLDVTDATGQKRIFTRDPGTNLLLSITGTAACQVCGASSAGDQFFTYDANGNLLTQTDALGNTTTFTYEPVFNKVASIKDALGNVTQFTYDSHGNELTQVDANGNTTTSAYNSFGQLIQITDPLNQKSSFSFDSSGNAAGATDALGNTVSMAYDLVSRPTQITDPHGNTAQFAYDNLDRVVSATNAQGKQTQFVYDAVGDLLSLTDTKGNKISFTYDAMRRRLTRTTPLGKTDTRAYDFNSNLTSFTDRRGQTSKFTYDALNRLLQQAHQDGSSVARSYDAIGRLVHVVDSVGGTFDFTYDLAGRLTSSASPFGTVQFAYDAADRTLSRQVVGQPAVQYSYDAVDNLLKASMPQASVTFAYDAVNQLMNLTRSNGVSSQYTYDAVGSLLTLTHSSGSTVLNSQTYTYDSVGQRSSSKTDLAQSLATQATTSQYDAGNRLLQSGATSFNYDDNGNVLSATNASGTTNFTWDARNRLQFVAAPNGQSTKLLYDFAGNLISQADSGPTLNLTQNFVLDDLTNVAYISRSNGASLSILSGQEVDEHLGVLHSTGQVEYGLPDALNSTIATVDAAGAIKTKFFYEPFGQTTSSGGSYPFQFTGRSPVGGLYNLRARYYDPSSGRFISEDPIGFLGGDANLYRYVFNGPINKVDPFGLAGPGGGAATPRAAKKKCKKGKGKGKDKDKDKLKTKTSTTPPLAPLEENVLFMNPLHACDPFICLDIVRPLTPEERDERVVRPCPGCGP